MNANDKYNNIVYTVGTSKKNGDTIKKEEFSLENNEFKNLIEKIESDGLFYKSNWALSGGYIFMGLTFDGQSFIENNDKKEYSKIEKTEIYHNHNINVSGNNNGNIVMGNDNLINSEFNKKFDELVNEISKSNLDNKKLIIEELHNNKNNPETFKTFIKSLSLVVADASISALIDNLLSL